MERTAAPRGGSRTGVDQIGDSLRLGEVHFAIQEGAFAELAGTGHPRPKRKHAFEHPIDDQGAAMTLHLQHMLTR